MSDFALSLHHSAFDSNNLSNFVTGPLSIYNALAILLLGTDNDTRKKLILALKEDPNADYNEKMSRIIKSVEANQKESIFINSNSLYCDGPIKEEFIGEAKELYNATVQKAPFSSNVEEAIKMINENVSTATKNKITEIVNDSSITNMTRLVIVNAVYFKGLWENQFDKARTHAFKFYKLDGSTVESDFMRGEFSVENRFIDDMESCAIRLPFKNSDFSCLIILPTNRDGLKNLYEKLDEKKDVFMSILKGEQFHKTKMQLKIPKFKIGFSLNMKDTMKKMGLEEIFEQTADYSKLSNEDLYLSEFLHKAVFEMNEEGAEAAAASALVANSRSMPMQFNADHPFIFGIVSKEGIPIFMGHIADPSIET